MVHVLADSAWGCLKTEASTHDSSPQVLILILTKELFDGCLGTVGESDKSDLTNCTMMFHCRSIGLVDHHIGHVDGNILEMSLKTGLVSSRWQGRRRWWWVCIHHDLAMNFAMAVQCSLAEEDLVAVSTLAAT